VVNTNYQLPTTNCQLPMTNLGVESSVVSGCFGGAHAATLRGSRGEGMSALRRDADRALRQFEKRTAGGPIRVRRDSPLPTRLTRGPTLISARRTANPSERGAVSHALEVRFSARRPRRRGADVPLPLQTR
jgi:hypothetical protein